MSTTQSCLLNAYTSELGRGTAILHTESNLLGLASKSFTFEYILYYKKAWRNQVWYCQECHRLMLAHANGRGDWWWWWWSIQNPILSISWGAKILCVIAETTHSVFFVWQIPTTVLPHSKKKMLSMSNCYYFFFSLTKHKTPLLELVDQTIYWEWPEWS